MYGALPFTGWGRFVRDGYDYAMHVRALLTHSLRLTLQPTSTICRSRRTEAPASARPQSPDPPAPRASVTGRTADRTATCGHRKPATDDAAPVRDYIWSKFKRMKSLIQMCPYNAWTNMPHTGIFKIFHFGGMKYSTRLKEKDSKSFLNRGSFFTVNFEKAEPLFWVRIKKSSASK